MSVNCHCGHAAIWHASTNNTCFIEGCPCAEGFQSTDDPCSPRLADSMAAKRSLDDALAAKAAMVSQVRDTYNAVALALSVSQYPNWKHRGWPRVSWAEAVEDIDRAAAALDRYQSTRPELWDDADWYLTLDRLTVAVVENPHTHWTDANIASLIVAQ
jgi:hypothetical protein